MKIRTAVVISIVLEAMAGGCSSGGASPHGPAVDGGAALAPSGGMAGGGRAGSGGGGAGGTMAATGGSRVGGSGGAGTGGGVGTGGAAWLDAGVAGPDGVRQDASPDGSAWDAPVGTDSGASSTVGPDPTFTVPAGATCYVPGATTPVQASACPANLCGNGQVDTCTTNVNPCDHGSCPPLMASEECDGTDLQGQACSTAGFAGGTLRCTSTCHLDWSGCAVCAVDPRIVDCSAIDGTNLSQSALALAVASDGSRVAMVWPALSSSPSARFRFGLVNDDLSITAGDCLTESVVNPAPALAAYPGGWVLAYQHAPGDGTYSIQIVVFDAAGKIVSMPAPSIAGSPARLVTRSDGMPLLLYSVADGAAGWNMAALLDSSGKPVWTGRMGPSGDSIPVATYTGDGFLWADRAGLGADPVLARIALDGTVATTTVHLGEDNYDPGLVWTGTEARMLWYGSWIALDKTGNALGPVHRLLDGQVLAPEAAVLGTNTAVLLMPVVAAPTGTGPRDLVLIDAAGNATAPTTILADGNQGPRIHAIVAVQDRLLVVAITYGQRLGPRLYAAWVRP